MSWGIGTAIHLATVLRNGLLPVVEKRIIAEHAGPGKPRVRLQGQINCRRFTLSGPRALLNLVLRRTQAIELGLQLCQVLLHVRNSFFEGWSVTWQQVFWTFGGYDGNVKG